MAEPARRLKEEGESGNYWQPEVHHGGGEGDGRPAGQLAAAPKQVYDDPGNAPSHTGRPELKEIEGGGQATEPSTGHLSEAGVAPTRKELNRTEKSGGETSPDHEQQIGPGYHEAGAQASRFSMINRFNRRRALLGGGALGTIVAILMFVTFLSGPFEFIHIAQLLEKFHFAGLQSQQDDRFAKEVRLFRYASKGQVESTRLGFLSNKYANRFETKLNDSGLTSSYTKTFGLFDGYVIDETNERFKGMTQDEIKQYIKENYGVDAVDGSSIKGGAPEIRGKLVIDASNLGYSDTYKLTYGLLREAGYSKISAAIGSRYLCERAACTSMLHPLSKKINTGKRAIEDWWNSRNSADREGSNAPELGTEEDQNAQKDAKKKGSADSAKAEADGDKSLSAKDISAKLGGSAAAVAGILCIAKGVAADAHGLKASQTQVLMRMGVEALGLGSQLESGQDVNLSQLAQYNTLLSGTDSAGNNTSWDQSQSIQANLGNQNTGVAPNKTLKGVTNDSTPFDFLNNSQPLATILGAVCSTPGQIISFLGGDVEGLVQGAVLSVILSQTSFASDLAHWLAGSAVDVDAVGADFGNEIDYGAALAANSQSVLGGGSALSGTQSAAVQSTVNQVAREEFDHQSTVHKLFSPYDEQSLISRVIDNAGTSPSQTLAKMGSMFLNFGHMFSSVGSILSGQADAATTGFDYGFPSYGFSQSDMADRTYSNPYENACYVTGCSSENTPGKSQPIVGFLTGSSVEGSPVDSTGQTYVDHAQKCFGTTISQVPVQTDEGQQAQWNVTSGGNLPNPYDDAYPKYCNDNSDPNWTRLRFFIMDTETMNSMGCYSGDDQACSDIGFSSTSTTNPVPSQQPTSTAGTSIDVTNLYKDSTSVACAAGTRDLGTQDGYTAGQKVEIKVCAIPNLPSTGDESTPGTSYYVNGANGQAVVNSRVSGAVYAMVQAADNDGVQLTAISSFRTMAHQQELCSGNAGCAGGNYAQVAKPGTSNHQMGLAIDFGGGLPSTPGPVPGNAFWDWLSANAAKFGYKNYPAEAWHWSPTGN